MKSFEYSRDGGATWEWCHDGKIDRLSAPCILTVRGVPSAALPVTVDAAPQPAPSAAPVLPVATLTSDEIRHIAAGCMPRANCILFMHEVESALRAKREQA